MHHNSIVLNESTLDASDLYNVAAIPLTSSLLKKIQVHQTPEPHAHTLQNLLAKHEQTAPEHLLLGHGATELIWHFLQEFQPKNILFVGAVANEYLRACQTLAIPFSFLHLPVEQDFGLGASALQQLWNTKADLIVIATPDPVCGITHPNFFTVLNMLRAPRVLIDNSLKEFLAGTNTYTENSFVAYKEHLRPGVSLFTLNSFSHFFACSALRLGYLIGERVPIAQLAKKRPLYPVSGVAQSLGKEMLLQIKEYRQTLAELTTMRMSTAYALHRSELFLEEKTFPGPSFLCCKLVIPSLASSLTKQLAQQNVLVYNCDTSHAMPAGFLRIQAVDANQSEMLYQALVTAHKAIL